MLAWAYPLACGPGLALEDAMALGLALALGPRIRHPRANQGLHYVCLRLGLRFSTFGNHSYFGISLSVCILALFLHLSTFTHVYLTRVAIDDKIKPQIRCMNFYVCLRLRMSKSEHAAHR